MRGNISLRAAVVLLAAAILGLSAGPGMAQTATLTATTDLNGGTPIPTDAGSFNDTDDTAPYVYYIDSDPARRDPANAGRLRYGRLRPEQHRRQRT